MLSENSLKRKTLQSSQTYKDYQDTSDNDTIYNMIEIGLIGLTGVGLYKSGALKGIMQPLLELADTIAKEGTDKAGNAMSTIKKWSKFQHLTQQELDMSKFQNINVPAKSLFRERDSSVFYDLFQDIKDFSPSNLTNFHSIKNIIDDTAYDMRILQGMIK